MNEPRGQGGLYARKSAGGRRGARALDAHHARLGFLHLSGGDTALTQGFAWAYVVLRIVHSLWQATVNRVPVRFALFALSTFCLLALSVLAVIATLG